MLAMWAITPAPVRDESPFMETYETWLAESSSVWAGTDRTGQEGQLGACRNCKLQREKMKEKGELSKDKWEFNSEEKQRWK